VTDRAKPGTEFSPEEKRAQLGRLLEKRAAQSESLHPLSHGQRSLWFLQQLSPASAAYNLMYAWRVHSALDVPALRKAFQSLVERHATLRTTYVMHNGKPVQCVRGNGEVNFEVVEASHLSEDELKRSVGERAHTPFDLSRDSVMRVTLFRRAAHEYVLLLTFHHIAIDFPSLGILLDELLILYPAIKDGTAAPLPPLKADYVGYALWQTELLSGPHGERLWSYWRDALAGELPVLNLPTDRPRPPLQTSRGATHYFTLDGGLVRQLKGLSRAEGVTPYVVLLAAFYVLLHRYTRQPEMLVGAPAGGRAHAEFEGIVGYFVNPVMLRANLSGDPAFRAFLSQVRATTLDALGHQDYPFSLLVERLQPARDPSRSPLCDVMFIMQRVARSAAARGAEGGGGSLLELLLLGSEGARVELGGLLLEPFRLEEQIAQLDLTLMLVEAGERILGSLPYNTDLFDAQTIERMANHYRRLLESVIADPSQSLSRLSLMTAEEQRQLLDEWGRTRAEFESLDCIHTLFEAQAARTPDSVAVVYEGRELSYRELNGRANQLARHLRAQGVGPDVLVGVYIERSVEMVVGVLAVLKAGGAYVPLDPMYPQDRLSFMLEDSGAPLLLTQQSVADRLAYAGRVVSVDADWPSISGYGEENLEGEARPENLAYVIYTSGSTGRPKGVMIEHRSAVNLAMAHQQTIYRSHPATGLRVGLNAPLAFDGCVERLLLLLFGHTIHVVSEEVRQDPQAMISYVERHRLDVLDYTPSQLRLLVEAGLLERPGVATRLVLVGGEPIDESLWREMARHPRMEFFNVYGPTECTVNAAVCRVGAALPGPSIGRPLANVEVYILDDHLRPVPVGVLGEIYVGGAGLARAYHNRPALTAERFIPNPFSDKPGARLYRTSDLGRFLPDGNMEFCGRADDQVKIRGFRIEPGEIEAVLLEHGTVKAACVVVREDRPGAKQLVAYLVPALPDEFALNDLRSFLKEKLPDYMCPSVFVALTSLPSTPNGKVDRKALPAPSAAGDRSAEPYIAPRTRTEQLIAADWMTVLHLERAGVNDNFFDVGGHSLAATQLILRLRESFHSELPLRSIFTAPTIAGLARQLVDLQLERAPADELARMLGMLEQLSDEDAGKLLEQ
jgi:amino acid adenylation domain-containing protein